MPSDAPRGPVARLADVLAQASEGARPTSIELAELLWLAGQTGGDDPTPRGQAAATPPTTPPHPPVTPSSPPPPKPADPAPATPPPDAPADRVPLRLPTPTGRDAPTTAATAPESPSSATGPTTPPGHTPVRVPVPPMVTHPLTLQRALRPLKRRVPSPVGKVIDEEATADRIARLGGHPRGWLPVLRPAEERWLRLCLVYDAGPTMPIWRPLVHELHTALAQSGIFRTVELHRAEPDGTVPPQAAHAPATGRTVTLVISDCMGPQWRDGKAGARWYRTLRRWATQMPVAVIQPLPERLWRTTALPTTPGTLSSPHPAAPSSALTFTPYAADAPPPAGALPVPVLEPSGPWLAHWAGLVADSGGGRLPGAVGWLDRSPPSPAPGADTPDIADLTPEDLVLRFRSTASPEAFRLAGHLAVGEPRLPLMRLVQAAVEERPRPQHLAEVILSGMLASDGATGSYAFRDGVRELLLRTLPRTARGRTRELLARVGGLIDERAGAAPGVLRAVAPSSGGAGPQTPVGEPFATVTRESARQLGADAGLFAGRYRLLERLGRNSGTWRAEDVRRPGSTVVVKQYPQRPPHSSQWADRLVAFRHESVAPVVDHGVDGSSGRPVPYLVTEFVPGAGLQSLLSQYRSGLRVSQLLTVLPPLAAAIKAISDHRLTLQTLRASHVVVASRGVVLTGDFAVDAFHEQSRGSNLLALAGLVDQMRPHPRAGDARSGVPLADVLMSAVQDLRSSSPDVQDRGLDRLIRLSSPSDRARSYSVLGPLRVTLNGRHLATGTPREQAMLCMLLLRRGRAVHHDELIDGLWGAGAAPANARRILGTYASRLRNALGPDSVSGGRDTYSLALPMGPDVVDLFTFQRLHDDARDARFAGDLARARELVRSALGLWRGTPLDGIPGPAPAAARADINRLRQSLLHTLLELNRELGATEREQSELDQLLQEFPHTEDEVLAPHEELPSAQLDDLGVSRELPDDQPTPPATTLTFEYLARPAGRQEDVRENLGREISHLLIRGGIGPDRFEMRAGPRGWEVTVAPEVHVLHVLTAAVNELPAALEAFPVLGLGVTLTHEPDPTVSAPTFPSGLRHLLGPDSRRAVVIVSSDLHERLNRSGRLQRRFQAVPQSDDWYCEVTTEPSPAPVPGAIESVILCFDGTLARLYSPQSARHAARALTSLIAERRDPEAALAGTPLLPEPRPAGGTADRIHPLDVLRAFARRRSLSEELHARLEEIELQAALTAKPSPHVANLLHTLARPEETLRLAIVTDTSPRAVTAYLGAKGLHLPGAGIHGRTPDLTLLMPDPDCPRRALEQLGTPADRCVLVGSSPAEAAAAESLRIAFIGYATSRTARERLAAAGVRTTVSDLSRLVDLLHDR
ncbi:SAV_2336 N-terminal domain-related protein [Streptomyces sp. NPDC058644]|uniref:SAV_2336 N-terminal domain-related protein n=1 Tax=unclassified Streptomyces TaxID=2593676 RepID=UPI003660E417